MRNLGRIVSSFCVVLGFSNHCKILVLAFTVFFATNAAAYREVSWNARSEGGSLALARALVALAKTQTTVSLSSQVSSTTDIASADCSVDVSTPLIGEERRATSGNKASCLATTTDGRSIQIVWDLSAEVLIAWGTRTYPRGFSFEGPAALAMYHAFAEAKKDGPELVHLDFDDVALSSAFSVYHFIEYTIFSNPRLANGDSDGLSLLNCMQEYYYEVGAQRPEEADSVRCDFVYCTGDDQGGPNQCYEYQGP